MIGFGRHWGMGFGTGGFSWIIMILFWALIIFGIVYLLRNLNNNNGKSHNYSGRQDDNAVNIARERYAKGEITKEELNEILDDLKQR
jgi:putative membrane protein